MLSNDIIIDKIIYVNHFDNKNDPSFISFKSDTMQYYQLIYKLSGEAFITYGETTINEKANDIRFLPNPSSFKTTPIYTAELIKKGECIDIAFISSSELPNKIIVKSYNDIQKIKQLFINMQKLWYYKHSGYYYKCMSVFYDILAEITKQENLNKNSKAMNLIAPAMEYIDNHFCDEYIDCDFLAKLCGISHTYMSKLFNTSLGLSPKKYIIMKRMQYACDLLNSNQYTIKEIAFKIGYSNEYYFSYAFKQCMGMCPSKYKSVT